MKPDIPFLPLCVAMLATAATARADLADPFATAARVPPLRMSAGLGDDAGVARCPSGLSAAPLSLIDAVDLALCAHPQTREAWAAARAQAAVLGSAQAAWLPTLDGKAQQSRVLTQNRDYDQRTASLTLSWLLFDAGQRSANQANAEALLKAALATQDATVQTVLLSVVQAFYTTHATEAVVAAARESERASLESFRAADARYGVGVATPADRLQAQTALSQATLTRIRAEGEARNARGALAYALGLPANTAIQLAPTVDLPEAAFFQREVDTLIREAQRLRPDLQAAEAQLRAAEASVDLARAQGMPTVSLGAGPSWQDLGGAVTRGGNVGLTLNVPLFTGFDRTYRVRAASAQADVRAAQRDRLRQQVALDVWKAYQSLNTATQSLQTTADLLASARQSEQVALGRYKAGVGTGLDLLAAQSALASARQQRIQAELDWNLYRAALAQAVGALDETLLPGRTEGQP